MRPPSLKTPLSSSCSSRRVALVHVDVVHPVLGAELLVDREFRRRVVEVRAPREQLTAAGLQIVELPAHHVLQVVVLARTGGRQGDPGRPVEQRCARVVERVGGRSRLLVQVGETRRDRRQALQNRMAQQRLGAMEDHQRLRLVARPHIDRNAEGLSLVVNDPDLQVRRFARSGRRILTLPFIQLRAQHTIDDGHWSPTFRQSNAMKGASRGRAYKD